MDQMVKGYRCYRRSRRYTVVLFSNIIDICALNAYVLYNIVHPDWRGRLPDARRVFLKALATQLIVPHIQRRNTAHLTVPMRTSIVKFLRKHNVEEVAAPGGVEVEELAVADVQLDAAVSAEMEEGGPPNRAPALGPSRKRNKAARCHVCPRSRDIKTTKQCSYCRKFVCTEHCRVVSSVLCIHCSAGCNVE